MWKETIAVTPRLTFASGDCLSLRRVDADSLEWVDRVMKLHSAPTLDKLTLSLYVDVDRTTNITGEINKWVEFAAKKRVQDFWLDLWPYRLDSIREPYTTDINFAHSSLNRLKQMNLAGIDASEENIKCLFSNASRLEYLWLEHSRGLYKLELVADDQAPPNFKHFIIRSCSELRSLLISSPSLECSHIGDHNQLQQVEIRAPNIKSLDVTNNVALKHFKIFATELKEFRFSEVCCPASMMEIGHVPHLSLAGLGLRELYSLDYFQKRLVQFSQAKQLILKITLHEVIY